MTFLLRFRAFEPCVHTLFLLLPSCIGLLWPYNPRLSAKISSKQPFRKLQKSTADMPANDKVGSWLGDAKGAVDGDESNGSDSIPVQRSSGQTRRGEDAEDEEDDDEEEEVNGAADGIKREENVDWETVLPKVRPALEDPSDKRRRTFIGRYLYVSESCKLHLAYAVPVMNIRLMVQLLRQAALALCYKRSSARCHCCYIRSRWTMRFRSSRLWLSGTKSSKRAQRAKSS